MEYNYGLNQGNNVSGNVNASPSHGNNSGTSLWIGQLPPTNEMQYLTSQMGTFQLSDTGTTYLDTMLAQQHNGYTTNANTTPNSGNYYVTNVQESPTRNGNMAGMYSPYSGAWQSNANLQHVPGQLNIPTNSLELQQKILETQQQILLLEQMKQSSLASAASTPTSPEVVYKQLGTDDPTPPTTTIKTSSKSAAPRNIAHHRSISEPLVAEKNVRMIYSSATPEVSRPQRTSLTVDTSSVSSSASIPDSPNSAGLPDNLSSEDGDLSPRNVFSQGSDGRRIPIKSQSLKYSVKFPQDKCYRCMKKVYKVEMLGPVKGAVYHKLCFTCKVCNTKLSLKNYALNQADMYDVAVYCKSHQPTEKRGAKLGADSVLIKGAMSVPKLDRINDQIKVKDGKYHVDNSSLEIMHARNVPAQNLVTGNRLKHNTWRVKNRKGETTPVNVVRHDEQVPDYDVQALHDFDKVLVEFDPDY